MARAVFPGTFDPIHFGHIDIVVRAARIFDEVIVGVYDKPLKSLLFSPKMRIDLVQKSFTNIRNVSVVGYSGLTVEFCKSVNAQVIVRGLRVFSDFEYEFRMALANHRLAPELDVIALITAEEHTFLSSSTVREIAALGGNVSSMVPPHVQKALQRQFFELGEGQQVVPATSLRD